MSRSEESIFGKNIITYTPRGGKRYSPDELGQYLRKFKLCDALRLIGEVSSKLRGHKKLHIKNVPIFNGVLAYLSMRLIENSNDYRSLDMTIDDLLTAIDMFFGIPDPFEYDRSNEQGCLIRFGASQLDYDREARHLLPRNLIIYGDLWKTVEGSKQIDIADAIQRFCGLTLQEILLLSFLFSSRSNNGFFCLYEEKWTDDYPSLKNYFSLDKQQAFANWISCRYSEFRTLSRADLPQATEYEKFRFNPLCLKPAIIPDRNPKPGSSQVYITPIPSLIYERVTRGLYFSLSEHFSSGKSNPFRGAFGSVFQEYVGLLLKKTFGANNVQQEWKYVCRKNYKDTPDWFVIQNGVAVMIEVKQSGLYLNAKKWGDIKDIQKNLTQSIGAGVEQMCKFERDVESGLCTVPDWFNGIKITERLVVTYDRSYFLNSTLRDEVRQLYPSISETYHWHTIAVEELEYFLGIVGTNFVDALAEKRLDTEGDDMDFRDYYSRKCSKEDCRNPYLDSVYDKFFGELGFLSKEAETDQF